jgi:hypothetical protein
MNFCFVVFTCMTFDLMETPKEYPCSLDANRVEAVHEGYRMNKGSVYVAPYQHVKGTVVEVTRKLNMCRREK